MVRSSRGLKGSKSSKGFSISRCKDTGISPRNMKRMMHKKEDLLQIPYLQQIFYQMSGKYYWLGVIGYGLLIRGSLDSWGLLPVHQFIGHFAKIILVALGEIAGSGEADRVGHLGYGVVSLGEHLLSPTEPHVAYQFDG